MWRFERMGDLQALTDPFSVYFAHQNLLGETRLRLIRTSSRNKKSVSFAYQDFCVCETRIFHVRLVLSMLKQPILQRLDVNRSFYFHFHIVYLVLKTSFTLPTFRPSVRRSDRPSQSFHWAGCRRRNSAHPLRSFNTQSIARDD